MRDATERPSRRFDRLLRLIRDSRGNVSAIMALMLLPMIGVLGLAAEGSTLFVAQRMAQNAADSAVVAAATNGCGNAAACHTVALLPTYASEARSVTAQHGFTDGVSDVVVTPSDAAVCPGGGTCYSVEVVKKVPLGLLRIVGFNGDTTTAGGRAAQTVRAVAMAKKAPGTGFCVTALGNTDPSFQISGAPNFDLSGCDVYVPNGGASCNSNSGDSIRYAITAVAMAANKPCGTAATQVFPGADYSTLASNIPNPTTGPCGGVFPQRVANGNDKDTVDAQHQLTGSLTFSAGTPKCGDLQLTGNVTVTADSVLIIQNGWLDLNGFTLSTSSGAHLTIVFGGSNTITVGGKSVTPDHIVTSTKNGGVMDYQAIKDPMSPWVGVAFYQDPVLTSGVDMDYSGNNPTFRITGLFYAPKSNIDIDGAINHASGGDACLAFMVKTMSVSGTGSIFAQPTRECDRAGLTGLGKVLDKVVMVL